MRAGRIGELRAISGVFSYFNRDPTNIRNVLEWGGGGVDGHRLLSDLHVAVHFWRGARRSGRRFDRARSGVAEMDRLASAMLDFPSGQAIFTCSTQMVPYQRDADSWDARGGSRSRFLSTRRRIGETQIFIDDGRDVFGSGVTIETFPVCDQYTIQGDAFSQAIRGEGRVPVPLEDSHREHGGDRGGVSIRAVRPVGKALKSCWHLFRVCR